MSHLSLPPHCPLSSGDLKTLPTQPQEAEPLLETEGGLPSFTCAARGAVSPAGPPAQALVERDPHFIGLAFLKDDKDPGASNVSSV